MNAHQKIAARVYGGGDYAHITKPAEADDVGDTLFTFIIRELGDAEVDRAEAIRRMEAAQSDIQTVIDALYRDVR